MSFSGKGRRIDMKEELINDMFAIQASAQIKKCKSGAKTA